MQAPYITPPEIEPTSTPTQEATIAKAKAELHRAVARLLDGVIEDMAADGAEAEREAA